MIQNEDIHYEFMKLNQNLMIHMNDHTLDKKIENRYLPILSDILEIYQKLESAGQVNYSRPNNYVV